MTIINTGENQIKWTVRKGLSSVNEDFTRSDVMLFAISQTNKIPLPITSKEKGVIVATIPHVVPATQEHPEYGHRGIQEDTYDVELVWIKNKRELNRTYLHNAFRVSDNPLIQTLTVEIVSTAQSYGYDGLSAYEIAMFRRLSEGESAICENQWLEDLLAEKANTIDLNAEIANRLSADSTLSSRIDSEITDRQEEDIRLSNRIQAEANARSMFDNEILDQINDINYKIPGTASDTNKLTDKQYVDDLVHSTLDSKADKANTYTKSEVDSALGLKANQTALENAESKILNAETNILSLLSEMSLAETAIDNIEDIIPSLATKEFVNSSVATNTATFRGTYNQKTSGIDCAPDADPEHVAERIPLVVLVADNNDYVFVLVPINQSPYDIIERVDRYKYVVDQNSGHWEFEYTLNNSGFTAEQWAALNSGITDIHVQKVNGLDGALAAKLDVLTFDSVPTANSFNPVTSNGLYIALQNILSTSGGTINGTLTMHGNIDMLMDLQHSWNSIKTTTGRNLFCFKNGFNGYMIGDESIKLGIQTGSNGGVPTPIYHRITINGTDVDYPVLDTYNLPTNVKTINNISVAGAGNIDINDAFKVVYGVTPIADVVNAYSEGKYIYAVRPDLTVAHIFILYVVHIDDTDNTDHLFLFLQYCGDGNDVSWFELTSEGYSEVYDSIVVTTGDLTAALSDYTTTSDLTTLLNNKQNTVDSNHKLSADVIDDSSATNKFVTSSDKTLWNTVTEKAPLPFVITCGIDPEDTPFVNSTLDEIWAAYQNGKNIRVKFAKAEGISFEDDATMLLDGSRNCVAHTVHNGTHYIVTIYDDNGTTKLSYVETYDNPEIVNLTDGEHRSGYYEDLMRTVGVVKLDIPQIFIYTAYDDNHIATTAMCFSTCTNTETPTSNAVIKQTLLLGTLKSIRTLSNIVSDNKYQVVNSWAQVIDVKQSDLNAKVSKSGDSMTGDLDLDGHALLVRKSGNQPRNGIKFENDATGVLVGNGNMNTTIQSNNADLKHRKGSTDYSIIDASNIDTYTSNFITNQALNTALTDYTTTTDLNTLLSGKQDTLISGTNIKTINNTSVLGSGDISTEVTTNRETSISASADNSHYPTSKAVYDYVSTELGYKQNVISDLSAIRSGAESGATAYQKPTTGIPSTDFDSTVLTSLGKADTAYQLPTNGIPATDLESTVLTSLGKADTAVQPATLNSYLQKSGGQMSGDINMNSNGLLVRAERNGIKFTGSGSNEGVYIGNGSMRLFLEADSTLDVKHKKGSNYYAMLDEGNTKTINSSSLYGSGDLLLYTVSDVKANLEAMFTALVSAGVIQNYTLTDPASGSKTFGFSFT